MTQKKEKPSYTLWQNIVYAMTNAWARERLVVVIMILQIVAAVGISTLGIFLPATVVGAINGNVELWVIIIMIILFSVGIAIFQAIDQSLEISNGPRRTRVINRTWLAMLNKVLTADYEVLEEEKFTDARQKAFDNSWPIRGIYLTLVGLGTNLLGLIIYVSLLTAVNPLLMVVAVVTSVCGTIVTRRVNKWEYDNDDEFYAPVKRLWYMGGMGENYDLAKDIRLFNMTNWITDMFTANLKLAFNFRKKIFTKHLLADLVNCVATFVREGIAYAYLIWLVLNGSITVEAFVLLFAAVAGFSSWIAGVLVQYAELGRNSLAYCRVREFLDYPRPFTGTESVPVASDYKIELKDVSFRYSGAEEFALENINLTIEPSEKLAVVGLNGAGKTTLIKLICGLYNPTSGQILINGVDVRNLDREQYYGLFTAVFQDFNILPLTIAENIASAFGEDIDLEKVHSSLELAGISEKVKTLPKGVDTLLLKEVHAEAVELSGGQTQRLMLARALYKNAPILILDEPTAALDPIAESAMYERYDELSAGRTSIYISHRLASTRFCDRIVLVGDKKIAEMGTHEELLKAGGKYAELYDIQSKYYQEELEAGGEV